MNQSFVFIPLFISLFSCRQNRGTVFTDDSLRHKEELKFCLVGNTKQDEKLISSLKAENYDRLVLMGNFPEQETLLKLYSPLLRTNKNLKIKFLLGNEHHKDSPYQRIHFSDNNPEFFFPNYYYMVDCGGLCVVAPDTNFYFYKNSVPESAEQTKWPLDKRKRLSQCKMTVAMTNHDSGPSARRELEYDDMIDREVVDQGPFVKIQN